MTEEKHPLHTETFFLPPLKMVLAFFDKESRERNLQKKSADEEKVSEEKKVERLIEKLSEKDD
jgi:hypothetical protein